MSIELQNAFALSRSEYQSSCQAKRIEELLAEGKFVIGYTQDICCRFTDAVLGYEEVILSVHETLEEAEAAMDPDDYLTFLAEPKPKEEPVTYVDDAGDCPF